MVKAQKIMAKGEIEEMEVMTYTSATKSMVHRSAAFESLLETQILRPHFKPT